MSQWDNPDRWSYIGLTIFVTCIVAFIIHRHRARVTGREPINLSNLRFWATSRFDWGDLDVEPVHILALIDAVEAAHAFRQARTGDLHEFIRAEEALIDALARFTPPPT